MTKLTDTQMIVLTAAAGRDDGSIFPLPKSIKGGAANKVVDALIRKGLVERIVDDRPAVDDFFKITRLGLLAINADPDEGAEGATGGHDVKPAATAARTRKKAATKAENATTLVRTRAGTKQATLIDMLRRDEGATIGQIVEATGWQPHTVRGAISGALKKKLGLTVESAKSENGERIYRIEA